MDATTSGFNPNNDGNAAMTVAAASPTSSQGSWVVDPDDGWDGLGAVPVPRSPEASHQGRQQPRLSPASMSLRGWAQVPVSPPAAEYPAMMANMHSPPQSPGSVRSMSSAGSSGSRGARAAAGGGLVALARDQNQNQSLNLNPMDISDGDVERSFFSSSSSPPLSAAGAAGGIVPRSLTFETFEALETHGFDQGSRGSTGGGVGIGCTTVSDVNEIDMKMDMDVPDADFGEVNQAGEHEHAFVMRAAPGMTAAEAVEAIAEAAELRGITPTSVVLSHTQVSPSRTSSGGASPFQSLSLAEEGKENEGHAQEIMFRPGHKHKHIPAASYRSMKPPRNPSPPSAGGVAGVPDVDAARGGGSRVSDVVRWWVHVDRPGFRFASIYHTCWHFWVCGCVARVCPGHRQASVLPPESPSAVLFSLVNSTRAEPLQQHLPSFGCTMHLEVLSRCSFCRYWSIVP